MTSVLISALLAAFALAGLAAAPAQAVELPAPTGLTPTSGDFATNPTLTWNRVPGATTYRVELSTNDAFSPLISGAGTTSTVNNRYVPTIQLPAGQIYWRVTANGSDPINWSLGSFTRSSVDVPTLLTPADNGIIHAPTEPEAYTWTPVAGATGYNLQVGDDDAFTDPTRFKTYATKRASYTLKTLPAAGVKYWRVQALLSTSVKGDWSAPRSREVALFDQGLPTQPLLPANNADIGVDEVVLAWDSIPGAATYDVQIDTEDQFLDPRTFSASGVVGSRYSPPGVLNNDQYWWRVRPVDAAGHAGPWLPSDSSQPWTFQRHWPDQAHLQYPADGATLSRADRVYFQWSGVHLATSYRLDLATTPNFADAKSCTTVNTTYTPFWEVGGCKPVVGTTYYWRVVAKDTSASGSAAPLTNPLAVDSEVHTFTYLPSVVDQTAPADGATVTLPTMTWEPVAGAEMYRVQVWTLAGTQKLNQTTYGYSLTPRTALPAGTYRWQVLGLNTDGTQITNGVIPEFRDTFTVESYVGPAAAAPDADELGTGFRPPTMTWARVTGATSYAVWVKRHENPTWTQAITSTVYPAGEAWLVTSVLNPGIYDYYVVASTPGGNVNGTASTFTIAALDDTIGHNAALVGTDVDSGDPARSCDATLPQTCQNLRQTPVLAWNADVNAGSWMLILSADPVLTDDIDRRIRIDGTIWADVATLLDTNATSGTYWDLVPCVSPSACVPTGPAEHVFNKQAPGVKPKAPTGANPHAYEVTLNWEDWLAAPDLANAASTPLTATAPTTEARYYDVQTSTSASFATVLENVRVDQTTYTSPTNIYPDGPIYWRVRASDGSDRPSAWSAAQSFDVVSEPPSQTTPASGGTFGPGTAFTWQPRELASSYEIKVLKNDGSSVDNAPAGSVALSVSGIQQTSYAPTEHLPVIAPPSGTSNNYVWFIRRKTVSGGVGPWSAGVPFRVVGQAPVQQSPAAGATVAPKGGLFTWGAVDGAASYRLEHRPVGGSASLSTTVALAYAPTAAMTGNAREWRVSAYDASGNLLGASGWRAYSTAPISGSVTISGQAKLGGTLTAAASFAPSGISITYQWYADSTPITGATGTSYGVKSADLGKSLTVRATATKSGYDPVTATSNAVTIVSGLAVTNTAKPAITGTTKVGYYLTASTGSWSPAPDSLSYQWLRQGVAITGATGKSYKLTLADLNHSLAVRVTAKKANYANGVATSAGKWVPKITTTTKGVFVDSTISRTTYPKLAITVTAPGLANPTGTVQVFVGSSTTPLKSAALGSTAGGKVTLTFAPRARGSYYFYVKYLGSAYTLPSTSPKVLLTVS